MEKRREFKYLRILIPIKVMAEMKLYSRVIIDPSFWREQWLHVGFRRDFSDELGEDPATL